MTKRYNVFDRRSDKLLFEGISETSGRINRNFEAYDPKHYIPIDATDFNLSGENIGKYNNELKKKRGTNNV